MPDESAMSTPRLDLASYRVLMIFKALLAQPCTLAQLNERCLADPTIGRTYSNVQLMRDVNCLRQWGCTIPKAGRQGYLLQAHPLTIPLSLAQQQAFISAAAADQDLATALNQLLLCLPHPAREQLTLLLGATQVIHDYPDQPPPGRELIQLLKPKLNRRGVVQFHYRRKETEDYREHTVEPIALIQRDGRHYLHAYCPDWTPPQETDFLLNFITDVRNCTNRGATQGGGPIPKPVIYRLTPPLATKYCPHPGETVNPDPELPGAIQVSLLTKDLFWLKKRLLGYGSHCEVLKPKEFRNKLAQEASALAHLYSEP